MSESVIAPLPKGRIQYVDALRGFTMLLVVFAHVETFGLFNFEYETFVGRLFQSFRMPLFFFISGFVAYKPDREWNLNTCWTLTKKKIAIQIIPTLAIGAVYTYAYLQSDMLSFISDPAKLGYWFPFVLLEMFVLYYAVSAVSYTVGKKWISIPKPVISSVSLIFLALVMYLLKLPFKIVPVLDTIGNFTSLHYTFNYFMYFVFGVLARQYSDRFETIIENKYVSAAVILLFAGVFFFYNFLNVSVDDMFLKEKVILTMLESIIGFLGVVVVYSFFRKYSDSFDGGTKLGSSLQYIGRRTLDIYLLHYFFLPFLPEAGDFLRQSHNVVLELFIGLCLSVLIVIVCLCVSNVIRLSPFLGKYLFGAKE